MPFIVIILFGILSACFALAIELLATVRFSSVSFVFTETLSSTALLMLFGIAFIEEASKYIFLRQYASRFFSTDSVMIRKAALLGASFGIGFAIPEILLVLYDNMATPPLLALLGTTGLHLATSLVFSIAIFSFANRVLAALILVAAASLIHTAYNLAVLFHS